MAHVGVAPLTLVRTSAGAMVYVYAGQVAPAGILKDELKRLVSEGYLEQVEDVAVTAPADESGEGPQRPKAVANKATWAEFRGLSEEQAKDVTIEQLKDDEFMASFEAPAPSA